MSEVDVVVVDGRYRRRLGAALAASAFVHGILLLLLFFDVVGPGGGLGIGVGPGVGVGAGGGAGLGEAQRQIFALSELEGEVRPPTTAAALDARLAALLEPEVPAPPRTETIARPEPPALAVIPIARKPSLPPLTRDVGGRLAAAGSGIGGFGGGGGGGLGWSLGTSFGRYVGGLRGRGLDVAIVLDATGSMQNVIDEIKGRMVGLVGTLQKLVPTARVGAVAFRDRSDGTASAPRTDEDYVVRWCDLTFNGPKVRGFVSSVTAASGGDWEEAVREGIETAIDDLSWRKDARKVIVLVGSSPPHAADVPQIVTLAERFRRMGGTISTIDVTARLHEEHERRIHRWMWGTDPPEISPLPDFYREVQDSYRTIAAHGGGEMLTLDQNDTLVHHLLVLTFGSEWRRDLARITRGM